MGKTGYEVRRGHRIDSGFVMAEKRKIYESTFALTKNEDSSAGLDMILYDRIEMASQSGTPSIVNFYLTKNSNTTLTKDNCVVGTLLPIIPIAWNIDSSKDMRLFIETATSTEISAKTYAQMPENIKRQRLEDYTSEMQNFVLFEFGVKYAQAKQQGDIDTTLLIKKLHMMKDFDLKTCSDLYAKRIEKATPEIMPFIKNFKQYLKTKDKYYEIDNELDLQNLDYTSMQFPCQPNV